MLDQYIQYTILICNIFIPVILIITINLLIRQGYSIKCDVWSLGVMFYRLFYNRMPWENVQSIEDLKYKINTQQIPYPDTIHPLLIKLIQSMLVIQENYRYSIL